MQVSLKNSFIWFLIKFELLVLAFRRAHYDNNFYKILIKINLISMKIVETYTIRYFTLLYLNKQNFFF